MKLPIVFLLSFSAYIITSVNAAALADSKCSNCSSKLEIRVVGATDVPSETSYPSAVHIPEANCGGTILNELYIITTAQCKVKKGFSIIAGNPFKSPNSTYEQKRKVAKKINHEKHNLEKQYENDISLVKLDSPLTFSPAVQPTKLFPSNFFPSHFSTNYMATVVGWGSVSPTDPHALSSRLKQIDLPYVNKETCKRTLPVPKHDTVDCFGFTDLHERWGGEGSCDGDEGSPLYGTERGAPPSALEAKQHRLIGIVSLHYCWKSIGNANATGVPGAFTAVRLYNAWMDRTLKVDGYQKGIKGSIVQISAPPGSANAGGANLRIVFASIAVIVLSPKACNFKLPE